MEEKRTRIGFVADYLNSEYSECLVSGITTCCKEHDVDLIIYQIGKIKPDNTPGHDYQYMAISSQINEHNVDGIIVSSGTQLHGMSKSAFASYLKTYKPLKIVSIAHEIPGIPSIICDSTKAMETLVKYLVKEQDCQKFGIMSVDSESNEMNSRAELIKGVLKKNDIPSSNVVLWKSNFHYSSAYSILNDYYTKKKNKFDFDAIIAMNDDLAFACLDFCSKRANLRVPKDIVVTGFDDMQRASFFTPTLTTVNQKVYYQGYKAALTLINQLNDKEVPPVQVIEAKAILRESTNSKKTSKKQFSDNDYISIDISDEFGRNNKFTVMEWFNKRQQVFQAALMDTYVQQNIEFEDVGKHITHSLAGFGMISAAVVVYDRPTEALKPFEYFSQPQKAKLIACFDYSPNAKYKELKHPVEFNPSQQMIPDGYFDFSGEGVVIMSLFHNTIQYGYIFLKRGIFDTAVYDLVVKAVANQIHASYEYTRKLNHKKAITQGYKILDEMAHIDYLTGLKNQRGFIELGETALKYAEAMGQSGLLLYFDIKNLKKVNDFFGHAAGDQVIKVVGEILQKHFRSNDIIARLEGDKFGVISAGLNIDNYKKVLSNISTECNEWKEKNNYPFEIDVSAGFAMFPSLKNGYALDPLVEKAEESVKK